MGEGITSSEEEGGEAVEGGGEGKGQGMKTEEGGKEVVEVLPEARTVSPEVNFILALPVSASGTLYQEF